jgi:hypothetical protein
VQGSPIEKPPPSLEAEASLQRMRGKHSLCEHGRVRSVCKQRVAAGRRTLTASCSVPLRHDEERFAPRRQNRRLSRGS